MTEHERRVNDEQIKAYEGNENKAVPMLPGMANGYNAVQRQYFAKALGQGGNSQSMVELGYRESSPNGGAFATHDQPSPRRVGLAS